MATNRKRAHVPVPGRFGPPPAIQGYRIDPRMPLHRLACKRIANGRDLKIIITAKDSQTGVGKTTAAGWLALSWTKLFTGNDWFCDPENPAEGMATLHPSTYFEIIKKVGTEWPAGTVVIVDDAEELDARRSMQSLNVEFSQRWMLMRLKQAITIITLPSPSSIDSRLEELSDIWINIERRGRGFIHDIGVEDYGSRGVLTKQSHKFTFPNIADHPELQKLRRMKEDKMASWDEVEGMDEPDPEEVERETIKEIAQKMRDEGATVREIADKVPRGRTWVSENTEAPD